MLHLFNVSVYHSRADLGEAAGFCRDGRFADGLELLTGYRPVDSSLKDLTVSVHLPYAVDWYRPYLGQSLFSDDDDADSVRFRGYGRDRGEIVESLRLAMRMAAPLEPAYGVLHACSANEGELLCRDYTDRDVDVVEAFAELLNEAVSAFPRGEPPFMLALENTWWPGLRMTDGRGCGLLEDRLEFENWGICLDTGHLLISMKGSDDEAGALEILNRCADGYPESLVSRIVSMHLHVNTSASVIAGLADSPDAGIPEDERFTRAYGLVSRMDQHRPFSDPAVRDYVERLDPDFVVHEMGATAVSDQIRDHILQRSLFSR